MSEFGDHENDAFRADVRRWMEANFPISLKDKGHLPYHNDPAMAAADADFQTWRGRVVGKGWGVPTWPQEYGGAGLSTTEGRIIAQEMARIGAMNPVYSLGVMMLGPTLLEFGTPEQKARHIPPIARGELRWCQGFSEPGAGSDLASLQTKCVDKGDHWLVNGQKIWTSGAHHAHWCFCLVRTDTSRKHEGISFLLIDMSTPGIEARPIQLISGVTHFCEVFFTDVKVPKENLVGEVNAGWTIAKRLLQHERAGLSDGRNQGGSLLPLARSYVGVDAEGRIADPDLRGRLIRHAMRAEAYALTLQRRAAEAKTPAGPTTAISVLKNLGSDMAQLRSELAIEILGTQGLGWAGEGYGADELETVRAWLYSKAFSIYGGSQEVQNNITAKQVLGLGAHR